MKKILVLLLVILFGVLDNKAGCPLINIPLNERIAQSDFVIEATVLHKESYEDSKNNFIYTAHTLQINKIFKGAITTQTITLITEGGFVGMRGLKVSPNLNTEIGQSGIFFLTINTKWETGIGITTSYLSPIGPLGFIYYDHQQLNAFDELNNWGMISVNLIPAITSITGHNYQSLTPQKNTENIRRATPAISGFLPSTIHAGTQEVLTITGTDFGATQGTGTVYFPNANDGGSTYVQARSGDIISWSDTKIELKVTSSAGTGNIIVKENGGNTSSPSASTLTIPWAHLNVEYANYPPSPVTEPFEIRHQSLNGLGGITWTWDDDFLANSNATASFLRALETWRCKTLINWSVSGNKNNPSNSFDGDNMVFYDNSLPGSVIGVCYSWYSGCFKSGSSGDMNWYVSELDIAFKKTFAWQYGPSDPSMSEYDFESVALHELGHGHQLGHVINSANVMHYAISNGDNHRELQSNDTACGNYIMSKSTTGVCSQTAMTKVAQVDCMVRDPLIFRSKKSGKWNELATWEYAPWTGAFWHDTIILPSFYIDSVIIRNGHTVEITDDRVLTRTNVNSGGILKWTSGNVILDKGINRNLIIENGGTFVQANDSTMKRNPLSNLKMDSEGILITSHSNGLLGLGSVYFVTPYKQTFIYNKSGSQNAGSALPASVKKLEVNNGSILTLQSNIGLSGELSLTSGKIKTGAYTLTLGTSTTDKGSLSYTSGSIEGTFARWFDGTNSGSSSGLFPLESNNNKKFVTVEFSSAPSAGGTLTASYINSSMGASGLPVAVPAVGLCAAYNISNVAPSYWQIDDGNGLSGGTYDIAFEAEGFDGITDLCELGLLKRSGMGSWALAGTPVQTSGTLLKPIVKVTGASGWSNFGFGGGSPNPLPITLTDFNVRADEGNVGVYINWTTVAEINNDYFEVQHSIDGQTWQTLEFVQGKGNSLQANHYYVIDTKPKMGINYYRIKQVDYDGHASLSSFRSIIIKTTKVQPSVSLYPNPAHDIIIISSTFINSFDIELVSIEGSILIKQTMHPLTSNSEDYIDIKHLAKGIYFLRVNSNDRVETFRVIKD